VSENSVIPGLMLRGAFSINTNHLGCGIDSQRNAAGFGIKISAHLFAKNRST
jgi:hypothetical protein